MKKLRRWYRECSVRRKLIRLGYRLEKGTDPRYPGEKRPGYRVVNIANGFVEFGDDFRLHLHDVERFVRYGR